MTKIKPEAREGEAFGYWVDHKAANSPVFIRHGSFVPASDRYTITKLYTHPAAPSADKLRDHLEWIETVLTDPVPGYTARIATAREYIDQALAALKAEGC